MIKYMLDTNICIYLIKRHPPAIVEKFAKYRKGEICISSITWAELCCGIKKDGDGITEKLLALLVVVPFGVDEARTFGALNELAPGRKANLDQMIAAHALSLGVTLVSNNLADFEVYKVAGLVLENWI